MTPGETVTDDIWVIDPFAINNDVPSFNATMNPDWSFIGATNGGANTVQSVTGPHAYSCEGGGSSNNGGLANEAVSLLATPPFALNFASGEVGNCTAASAGSS